MKFTPKPCIVALIAEVRSIVVMLLLLVTAGTSFAASFIECSFDTEELLTRQEIEGMLGNNEFISEIHSLYTNMSLLYCSALYHGNLKVQAHAVNQIAFYYYCKAEYSNALELLIRGHNYSLQTDYVHGLIDYHCYMGLISQDLGNTENALVHYRAMLKLAEEDGNTRWRADAYINIGSIYSREGHLDEAEQYITTALNILADEDLTESVGWANSHLGSIYALKGDTLVALEYYEKSIDIWNQNQVLRGLAFVYNDLGVLMKNRDPLLSINYHKQAKQYAVESDFMAQQLVAKLGLGQRYADISIDSSYHYLDAVLQCEESTSLSFKERASRYLMELSAKLGKNSRYQEYLKINHATLKELLEFQNVEHRNWLRLEREMLNLEQETYKQTLVNERSATLNRVLLFGFALLTLMVMGLTWYFYKYLQATRQTQEANRLLNENVEILRSQSEELAGRNVELDKQKTTLNGQLANKLAMVREIHLKNEQLKTAISETAMNTEEQRKLIRIIDNNTNTEILQNLDDELEQVHSSLFSKLMLEHPKLTSNNLKLISYVKMHLSNKEIADLLYISSDSVKVAKNRLKKKLKLGSSDSIDFYIHSLER